MQAHEHFAEGQRNLAQAATAQTPDRLIGMAQAHFMAAQTIIQANAYQQQFGLYAEETSEWQAAIDQQFGPDGKPVAR